MKVGSLRPLAQQDTIREAIVRGLRAAPPRSFERNNRGGDGWTCTANGVGDLSGDSLEGQHAIARGLTPTSRAFDFSRHGYPLPCMSEPAPDVTVESRKGLILLCPVTAAGRAWLETYVETEPWRSINGALAVDGQERGQAIILAALDAGLHVGDAVRWTQEWMVNEQGYTDESRSTR